MFWCWYNRDQNYYLGAAPCQAFESRSRRSKEPGGREQLISQTSWCQEFCRRSLRQRGPGAVLSALHHVQDNLKFMTSLHFLPAASATQRPQSAGDINPAWQVGAIPVLKTGKWRQSFKSDLNPAAFRCLNDWQQAGRITWKSHNFTPKHPEKSHPRFLFQDSQARAVRGQYPDPRSCDLCNCWSVLILVCGSLLRSCIKCVFHVQRQHISSGHEGWIHLCCILLPNI